MTKAKDNPEGFLAFTLHAHLPYVVNHGTWPHGIEWLHEAAAETYLPLLRVLANLECDNVPANFNLILSPILLEQLAHPYFLAEFPKYLTRKIVAAGEDEAYFIQSGDAHLAETARLWRRFFTAALDDFNALGGDIIQAFRRFSDVGTIELLTSTATHGYLPLLGTDESVRAQIRLAVETHIRHFGSPPRGIWVPECGYRPAGLWSYPVPDPGSPEPQPAFQRIGIEQAIAESGLDYFFVDTPLIEQCERIPASAEAIANDPAPDPEQQAQQAQLFHDPHRTLYQPYYVQTSYGNAERADWRNPATVFPRDPRTAVQVWSGDTGYPGDPNYLDFHKKRFPGGHRYWRITGPHAGIADKAPYVPEQAAERVRVHAGHFAQLVRETLQAGSCESCPPILAAPFDAELFGHWWFEGPMWLEAVCRALHASREDAAPIATIRCSDYLDRFPRAGSIAMHEGSWGVEGNHQVWLNPETAWIYTHIYSAELYIRSLASSGLWRASELATRIARQLCRELLLLEASDWQFLITTGAARDYAEMRFLTHNDQFNDLKAIWQSLDPQGALAEEQSARLAEIERRDGIFPDLDPALWAAPTAPDISA